MEATLLRKVQLEQLEIAKEIRRVCEENDIRYFLAYGTMLGAVRHQGFIPWDDDMDMGMVRSEYEKFCRIAPEKLDPGYFLQTWHTDPEYGLPFAKVRKRNTVYVEGKSKRLKENGFYVDIFPFDELPATEEAQEKLRRQIKDLYRIQLMKCGYKPWRENGRTVWPKRIAYLIYQARAIRFSEGELPKRYDEMVTSFPEGDRLYGQDPSDNLRSVERIWCEELADYSFEGEIFKGPKNFDGLLTATYGAYMQLPPEDERENRHQIEEVSFGE